MGCLCPSPGRGQPPRPSHPSMCPSRCLSCQKTKTPTEQKMRQVPLLSESGATSAHFWHIRSSFLSKKVSRSGLQKFVHYLLFILQIIVHFLTSYLIFLYCLQFTLHKISKLQFFFVGIFNYYDSSRRMDRESAPTLPTAAGAGTTCACAASTCSSRRPPSRRSCP